MTDHEMLVEILTAVRAAWLVTVFMAGVLLSVLVVKTISRHKGGRE